VARLRAYDERLATMFEPMLGVTFTPTRIKASEKINVIPSRAELKVDCRVPPGLGEQEVRRGIAEVLGEGGFQVDFTERVVGNRSPMESELMNMIIRWIGEREPDAQVVPVILPGFTDSRHFRAAFPECVAYGFFPHRHQSLLESAPLVHAADERIDLRDLAFATDFYSDLARSALG
jgi:acetylornithine deacetylase/succinyl-diaminopimelate desuccinylase-like protein